MEANSVAIYLDFENLAISAETVYPSQDKPLALEPIMDYLNARGAVRVKRAYADWSKDIFSQYQGQLLEQGFELIHLPATNLQGRNGTDVRLAIDVIEQLDLVSNIRLLILGSGDSDFIPLIQRIRTRGIQVVLIGFKHSVSRLARKNSMEFVALEELLGEPEADSPSSDLSDEPDTNYGRQLLQRYVQQHDISQPVRLSRLKHQLLQLDPAFSEHDLGFDSFKQFLLSLQGEWVERIAQEEAQLPMVYLRKGGKPARSGPEPQDRAAAFLNRKLRYQKDRKRRLQIADALLRSLHAGLPLSMNDMFEAAYEQLGEGFPKTEIKKYINTLFTGGAFKAAFAQHSHGPLLTRPFRLQETITHPEALDQIYIRRIGDILQNRYPGMEDKQILELLI